MADHQTARSKAAKREERTCFGVAYFRNQNDADAYAAEVRARGLTYNGGWLHGQPCGRAFAFDHTTKEGERFYAVTD